MRRNRLEAFSDGVLAIIITIMVLELEAPHGQDLHALKPLVPSLLSYVLSFAYVGIYWNNHHHLLHAVQHVSGRVLWANLHLLFWLSLLPSSTGWMGQNPSASLPTAVYGVVLLMAALAYYILQTVILSSDATPPAFRQAFGRDWKGKISVISYVAASALAFYEPWLAQVLFVVVALLWLIPDRRIERALRDQEV